MPVNNRVYLKFSVSTTLNADELLTLHSWTTLVLEIQIFLLLALKIDQLWSTSYEAHFLFKAIFPSVLY